MYVALDGVARSRIYDQDVHPSVMGDRVRVPSAVPSARRAGGAHLPEAIQ
jgi:hypothetical protein